MEKPLKKAVYIFSFYQQNKRLVNEKEKVTLLP
jgi:hypothetical protein